MNGGRYPHCPIAPGKGCQSCYDIEIVVRHAVRADRRRTALVALLVLLGFALYWAVVL